MTTLRTACPLDCPDGCTLEVVVEGGRLVKVDAAAADVEDPTLNPFTQGFICKKVKGHHRRVYSPDRVLTPQVRTGAKGSGEFRPVSWDEALDLVAARIAEALADDPATVVPYLYNSSAGELGGGLLGPLLWDALGASKVEHTICAATAGLAWAMTFGGMIGADPLDVVHSQLVVVWGANPSISNTHFPPLVQHARRNGAALVVVDPRRTGMAKRADLHLAVRPGTDVVLAMAVARELRERGAIDLAFTDAHADGVDEYLEACEPWTRAAAATECGIDPAEISAFVDLLVERRPAFWRTGWGMERNRNGGSGVRSVLALPVLSGAFGRLGSGVHLHSDQDLDWDHAALCDAVLGPVGEPGSAPRGQARRLFNQNRLGHLLTEPGDEPPVRVLVVQGANPAVMNPAQAKVQAGLGREDLFTVVHDQVLTDTARYADVVLPATTHFEASDVGVPYGSFAINAMPAVIGRVGESRTNDELSAGLAARLGFAAGPGEAFDPDVDRLRSIALPGGVPGAAPTQAPGTAVQFRDVWPDTRGGRARLVAGSRAQAQGATRVPGYQRLESDFPLTLVSPANARTINSIFGEIEGPSPAVHVHPDDAAARGLVDGQDVTVVGASGSLDTVVAIDVDLRPGVASMPKGLWPRAVGGGFTANLFAPDTLSDLAGGACFNDARVDVRGR
ncbi:MAG: molybdopterin-containing oxidoreductase family protein [Acidimicrobiales bacterium]